MRRTRSCVCFGAVLSLPAAALLLLGATHASAFGYTMAARGPTSSLTTSDSVIIDGFLDSGPGRLQGFSVGILYPNDGTIVYDGPAAAALPQIPRPGSSGAQPSYILYTGAKGSTIILYPGASPFFPNLASGLPPGQEQVDIDYFGSLPTGLAASGTGIYIATLLGRVARPSC